MSVTRDLSPGGVVHSASICAPGRPVSLRFALPVGPAEVRGMVRWAKRMGCRSWDTCVAARGVQFTWVALELRAFPVAARRPAQAVA